MKIQQETTPFRAITIKLKKRIEAEALFSLVDKIESYRCNDNSPFTVTESEAKFIVALSNANTNEEITL